MPDFNRLRRKLRPIVLQPPRSHLLRLALGNAHDDVAVPRPRMITVVLARPRRMIWMRVIPADNVKSLLARSLFRFNHVLRSHRKTVSRRIVAPVDHREKRANFARLIFSKQRPTAFMWIR